MKSPWNHQKTHRKSYQILIKSHPRHATPRLAACSKDPQALRFASLRLRADAAFVRSIGKAGIKGGKPGKSQRWRMINGSIIQSGAPKR